ncbi:MAG TPA: gamma-glutamyl-gamma-aminobutyrate hydrolase family protein [Candidatus Micrarchaeaceae archaeon]|nr:gamma-glutamyl-gamma-aminobutyrate hydrolase family protein [Candidatus Micrarchaeaceae archaeon]
MTGALGNRRPIVLVPAQSSLRSSSAGSVQLVQSLNRAYVAALQSVGLNPVLLPTRGVLPVDLSWASGLLLPGGPDVDPLRYGQDLDPSTEADPESDQLEFGLLDWALGQEIPILAICRGLQVLNVGLGGSLVQDLPRHLPQGNPEAPRPRNQTAHALTIDPASRLGRIVWRDTLQVNSMHHQGIDQLAAGLSAIGWSPDGLIEAVEMEGRRFVLGVQYHPEELAPEDQSAQAIFEAFAQACRQIVPDAPSRKEELVTSA